MLIFEAPTLTQQTYKWIHDINSLYAWVLPVACVEVKPEGNEYDETHAQISDMRNIDNKKCISCD